MNKEFVYPYASPLGKITMVCDGEALTGLLFVGQRYYAAGLSSEYEEKDLPVFALTRRWLDEYFTGKDPGFTPPLHLRGTDFRKAVWKVLLTIPYGQTASYGEIAAAVAQRTGASVVSARAVGGAVGHNPVSLIVPCHRVVGADGSLTGYAGGLDRKQALLALEQRG